MLPPTPNATAVAASDRLPPKYVPYSSRDPSAFSQAAKPSHTSTLSLPGAFARIAVAVVGKLAEQVDPTTNARPIRSTAIAFALESKFPPRKVEYTNWLPDSLTLLTNPVQSSLFTRVAVRNAPAVTGKSLEGVLPTTYAFPTPSIAIPIAHSLSRPPR